MREKLIELLHIGVRCPGVIDSCNDCPHHSLENPCDEFGATADMLIANGVMVQKWIPVTERLPDQYHRVFMAGRNGGVFIGERTSGTTAVSDGHSRGFTHWMELPNAPEVR